MIVVVETEAHSIALISTFAIPDVVGEIANRLASAGYLTNAAATEAQLAPQIVSKSPNQENTFFHHNSDPFLTKRHDSSYSTACLWKSS